MTPSRVTSPHVGAIVPPMPADAARLSVSADRTGLHVLAGEIDAHTAPLFAAHFDPLPDTGVITLDMSGVTFMDSSGLRALVDLAGRAGAAGSSVAVQAPSRSGAKIIEISGLTDVIQVHSG